MDRTMDRHNLESKSEEKISSDRLVQIAGWLHNRSIFVMCLFIICAVTIKILYQRIKWIAHFIPESCVFILFGSAIDFLLSETSTALARLKPTFTIDIFFAVLLPPIMLESAYSLNQKYFYLNIVPILIYAVLGTMINIAAIGPSLFAVVQLDSNKWLNMPSVSLLELTIFGASLSAIDPVSVLALFKDLKVKRSLYYLVFGESLLNDAVVLVIFRILFDILQTKQALSARIALLGLAKFAIISVGSLLIGVGYGVASSLLTLITKHVEDAEPIVMLVLAYSAYVSAEIFEWSGVVSIIGCGLFQAEFAFRNISWRSRVTVGSYVKALSSTADVVIFIFIGMIVVQSRHHWNVAFILFTFAFCVLYRALSVFTLTYLVNTVITTATYVPFSEQLLMVHAGLRGAIAYALISTLSPNQQNEALQGKRHTMVGLNGALPKVWQLGASGFLGHNETEHLSAPMINLATFRLLQTTTLVIIVATIFLMGSTTKPLLKYLRIKCELDSNKTTLLALLSEQLLEDIGQTIGTIVGHKSTSWFCRASRSLKTKCLDRVLVRKSKCINVEDYFGETSSGEESDGNVRHQSAIDGHRTASSLVVATPYETILRKYLAKQLRDEARGARPRKGPKAVKIFVAESGMDGALGNGTHTNPTQILHGRAAALRQRYDARHSWTANQHNQPNRINLSVHTPERVSASPTNWRPADCSQQRSVASSTGHNNKVTIAYCGPTTVGSSMAIQACPHLPNSNSSFVTSPRATYRQMPARLQSPPEPPLATSNASNTRAKFQLLSPFDPTERFSQNGPKRYRSNLIFPYNFPDRSDT